MKRHFFLKLVPARPTFAQDMSPDEKEIMQQHIVYWTGLMQQGRVSVFGPVFDPAGVYGIGVVEAEDDAEIQDLISRDPATQLNRYEVYPMRAVLPS
jgi:uncharacterized protein YciI